MPSHIADPYHVVVNIDGAKVSFGRAQASTLRRFDMNGELHDDYPDKPTLRLLIRTGYVMRTRGFYVLTPKGHLAYDAVIAYFARKADALKGG